MRAFQVQGKYEWFWLPCSNTGLILNAKAFVLWRIHPLVSPVFVHEGYTCLSGRQVSLGPYITLYLLKDKTSMKTRYLPMVLIMTRPSSFFFLALFVVCRIKEWLSQPMTSKVTCIMCGIRHFDMLQHKCGWSNAESLFCSHCYNLQGIQQGHNVKHLSL